VEDREVVGVRYFLRSNFIVFLRNRVTYLPTMVFMTIGLVILFAVMCGVFSFFDDLNDRLKNASRQDIVINHQWALYHDSPPVEDQLSFLMSPRRKNVFPVDEDAVLMPSDLVAIRERFGNSVSFKAAFHSNYVSDINVPFKMVFLSDAYMEPFLRQKEGDFIVTSRRVFEHFVSLLKPNSNNLIPRHFPFLYDAEREVFTDLDGSGEIGVLFIEDALYLDEFDLFPVTEEHVAGEAREPTWDEYLFIPFKYYFDFYYPADNSKISLRAGADDFNDLYELLNLLNQTHKGKVTYGFIETSAVFLRGVSEQAELVAIVIPVTLIMLFIIGLNFTGLQMLSVKRRLRDFAIQTTCGAGRGAVVGGTLFLTMLTVTGAAVLASFGGVIAVELLDIRLYNVYVTVNLRAIISVFGFAWIVGLLSCAPSLVRLVRFTPVEILTEQ
jgi:ABC-type antimicrobial peptide transport system permease subunit